MMPVITFVCYLLAFACFVACAAGRSSFGRKGQLVLLPAGLALAIFPSLVEAFLAVD